jgi:hypothetical protein
VITDALETIKKVAKDSPLSDRLLLAYIPHQQKEDIDMLYRLYVDHRIRKLQISPNYYFGYVIFDHFFWHSEDPSGFF